MVINNKVSKNWFEQGGKEYARFRPEYPAELVAFLASVVPAKKIAVDVGCGNGQLTKQLAQYFSTVVGIDPSASQIDNAIPHEHVSYYCASAEQIPLTDNCANLITAAQAAHWFDLLKFYAEVQRIAVDGGVLALISYGVLNLEPVLNERFQHFYWQQIGRYWPAERQLVDTGYASLNFPFQALDTPKLEIKLEWNLQQFLGYIATWSAVQQALEKGREDILQLFANDITVMWGDPMLNRPIAWPINMRVGVI
ncbi:class I SAM-dependent methyltransferase [Entomomonas asaccharolytica]|uniref:Class I SAM-dependent methyltransferase n=1 Tax=Entomomonas asaccharolytica TaxID=2785331 RepID=A0A974NDL5_9GAMM|nr:class I SAM-dependent methyltransferase [Entomomonas asaccharolytica]QQP84563.1 class I SAM-dependent methyltransferase [Entomomonas asaccharolytica]